MIEKVNLVESHLDGCFKTFISSPGLSPGRAIVLPSAAVLAKC